MNNNSEYLINSFINKLIDDFISLYGNSHFCYINTIRSAGKIALDTIKNSNAAYHDIHHTIMVADVGQEILKGRIIFENNVSPYYWFHFIIAALYHDIGYIRGLCDGDKNGTYIKNILGETVHLPKHSTDAALAPYHIDRAKHYARTALSKFECIDHDYIESLIERTRFPVPPDDKYKKTNDLPGLLRAADLIGQVADINYSNKSEALFSELEEIGSAQKLGYKTGHDLRAKLPVFFKINISPYINEALKYLDTTDYGRKWIKNLSMNILNKDYHINGETKENLSLQSPTTLDSYASYNYQDSQKKNNHQQLGL
ncbi:MAG: metal-dependent phosphohydrolase [Bacteroidota bacterium]